MSQLTTLAWTGRALRLLDQTQLPRRVQTLTCRDASSVFAAIRRLSVRGAPAIGVAGAFGAYLGVAAYSGKDRAGFIKRLDRVCRYLNRSRPTARNLSWALARMQKVPKQFPKEDASSLKRRLLKEAQAIFGEEEETCERMAQFGSSLVRKGDAVLTHCNSGFLATVGIGTALGVLYQAHREGKRPRVYATETRPLFQGSRLTVWELRRHGLRPTLLCEGAAGELFRRGKIQKVFTGADRIAANGDTANKVGTFPLALLAKTYRVPFYIVAPASTFDLSIQNGSQIPIEERPAKEVTTPFGVAVAPPKVLVFNPAFDVTPASLISAFVTDRGILRPPYRRTFAKAFHK